MDLNALPELGDFADDAAVFAVAWRKRHNNPEETLWILYALRGHIEETRDPKGVLFLLPEIKRALVLLDYDTTETRKATSVALSPSSRPESQDTRAG